MPLIGQVGRRRFAARFAMTMVYAVLTLGAVTTLYPFALMITTGFKGGTDQNDNRLIPVYWKTLDAQGPQGETAVDSLLGKYLDDKYSANLSAMQSARIGGVDVPLERILKYERFLASLPNHLWEVGFRTSPGQVTGRLSMRYQAWLRSRYKQIDELNKLYVEESVAFQTIAPPVELLDRRGWRPSPGAKTRDWQIFKASLPSEFRLPLRTERVYQEFVRAKYENQFSRVPADVRGSATRFESLTLPKAGALLEEFRLKKLPEGLREDNAEKRWAAIDSNPMPIDAYERWYVSQNASEIRKEFTWRNYRYVLDYILINGRAVFNTIVFCALVILTQLFVNPIAAYALSRYPVRASAKILMFLLATMAFPAEVAMIPSFLLLKDLGLLNTFAALVLPGAALGFMIFLLKGFFDSLPQELFESGQIDGARETTMLWKIALPLSKPVLGYLSLMAFMGAYGAFMYAFLVAQDQRMWTLMVFIYQLQQVAPKAVMMAALTLAAVPTLVVFLFAQRVIMRGIVLPGER